MLHPLLPAPVVTSGDTPPDANPLASDIIARNLVPFAKGNWVENAPLPLLTLEAGTVTVRCVPYSCHWNEYPI